MEAGDRSDKRAAFCACLSQGDVDWRLELLAQFDAHSPVCQLIAVIMENGKWKMEDGFSDSAAIHAV
jgi:hypothetical protein